MDETAVDTAERHRSSLRPTARRRIRHQARDTLAVMALSATCSLGLALTFVLIASLAAHG